MQGLLGIWQSPAVTSRFVSAACSRIEKWPEKVRWSSEHPFHQIPGKSLHINLSLGALWRLVILSYLKSFTPFLDFLFIPDQSLNSLLIPMFFGITGDRLLVLSKQIE